MKPNIKERVAVFYEKDSSDIWFFLDTRQKFVSFGYCGSLNGKVPQEFRKYH